MSLKFLALGLSGSERGSQPLDLGLEVAIVSLGFAQRLLESGQLRGELSILVGKIPDLVVRISLGIDQHVDPALVVSNGVLKSEDLSLVPLAGVLELE